MGISEIEVVWWAGCPSTERTLAELHGALDDLGLGEVEVRTTEVRTEEDARARGFLGSPTILIDGEDPFAAEDGSEIGLSCRVYRRGDGRVAPTPDPEELRRVLRRKAAPEGVGR